MKWLRPIVSPTRVSFMILMKKKSSKMRSKVRNSKVNTWEVINEGRVAPHTTCLRFQRRSRHPNGDQISEVLWIGERMEELIGAEVVQMSNAAHQDICIQFSQKC
eukprot:GFUD01122985.1.p1 GENE.GFUD01122985.1~~GFUD01122985.1.p1  ORF type:complete len:105 (+),score=27.00 GFUD01122985.1:63-377(+)